MDINLNFSTNTTGLRVSAHEVVQLHKSIVVWARSNVEHHTVLRLQELADALEEPLVRVDLSIVSLLDTEHEIDSSAAQYGIIDSEVPRRSLEAMENVGWDLFVFNVLFHHITHLLHGEFSLSVRFHETFLEQNLFIEQAFLTHKNFHACRNFIISIDNESD